MRKLLIANRGEIARRVIRTAHAMGVDTVAVYSEGDADAPYVREAGSAVALTGRSAGETYLNVEALIEAARRTNADAVHPGYGFLSENPVFSQAVRAAGLVFVGPPTQVIAELGDKLRAKALMGQAGVPVLDALEVAPGGGRPDVSRFAYPLLVKAAAGGGGKGMRVVRRAEDLSDALAAAAREAEAAFGDGRVFIEPYLEHARHIEIQILGDSRWNVVHCYERECSIQRRHQKIIEEAPSSALSPELRDRICEAALQAGRAVGYEGAGTVEFMLGADGRFFFLEVNTRLQVEHPVTEAITGLDLVREQLIVASGGSLSFGQGDLSIDGHAIEARLYAEDPRHSYLPDAGRVEVWREASDPAVRYDTGIESGSVVGIEFDPMLAKVIAHAQTRPEAASRLALALERTAVHGLKTNRELLITILRDDAFLAGATPTTFLEERDLATRPSLALTEPASVALAAVAAAVAGDRAERQRATALRSLPSGWRNSVMPPERRRYVVEDRPEIVQVDYRHERGGSFMCTVSGIAGEPTTHAVELASSGGDRFELTVDGVREPVYVSASGSSVFVDLRSGLSVELAEVPRFPEPEKAADKGALVAPMPGRVLSVHASAGDNVAAGQLLVIVEAMKMEHRITAPAAGHVRELHAVAGQQVATGDVLVALDPHGAG